MDVLPVSLKEAIKSLLRKHAPGALKATEFLALFFKSRGIKIHWNHPSPTPPHLKGFLTRELKEWDFDTFWQQFSEELIVMTHGTVPQTILERNTAGTEVRFKARSESVFPVVVMRTDKEEGRCEARAVLTAWKAVYQVHKDPLRLEVWAEWVNVPGYYHQGLVNEKQAFLDQLLKRMHPDVRPGSVLVREGPSTSDPWVNTIVSDALDAFADFDTLWDNLLEMFMGKPLPENTQLQNVTTDGFIVFHKGSGNRSSWSWTKYKYNKYKEEDVPKVGPAVENLRGEIFAEHYTAWRELKWRSYTIVWKRPLRVEFRGEPAQGQGPRIEEPNLVLYLGLLTIFGKLFDKKVSDQPRGVAGRSMSLLRGLTTHCRRRRLTPEGADGAMPKDKSD